MTATFERIRAVVEAIGPVEILPEKTRIAFHVRMSFAAFMPRKTWLDGHLGLAHESTVRGSGGSREYSPRNVLHAFRLATPADVDEEFAAWLAEALTGWVSSVISDGSAGFCPHSGTLCAVIEPEPDGVPLADADSHARRSIPTSRHRVAACGPSPPSRSRRCSWRAGCSWLSAEW